MCNANKAAATVLGTVASVSSNYLTLNAGWNGAVSATKWLDGIVEWTNAEGQTEVRRILSVTGDTLTLGGLLRDLEAAMTVSVILGCNHQQGSGGDCGDLHNNIQNFGGCSWIPVKNPIGFGQNQFY